MLLQRCHSEAATQEGDSEPPPGLEVALEAAQAGHLGSIPMAPLATRHEQIRYPAGASHLYNGGQWQVSARAK